MKKKLYLALGFGLLLSTAHSEQVIFTEIMYNPAGTRPEYIEIKNISWTPRDICKWRFSDGITYEFPDFNTGNAQAAFIQPLERIIISSADASTTRAAYGIPVQTRILGPWTGSLDNDGERLTLKDKNDVRVGTVNYKNGGNWSKAADGSGHSLMIRNENNDPDDWRNWMASASVRGSGGATTTVINYGDTWSWNIPTSDPGSSWRTATSGWASGSSGSGAGFFGFETALLQSPGIQTPVGSQGNQIVYLFRKSFTFNGNVTGATFEIDGVVDDGVTYYLNGNPIGSWNFTPGSPWDKNADLGIGDAVETLASVSGTATGLINGSNVLAAEVHQGGTNSSDLVFGARLKITEGGTSSAAKLRLSEVHFDTNGNADWIELQNYSSSAHSAVGLFLTSKSNFSNKVALTGTVNANGYLSFAIPNGGFATDSKGQLNLFLVDGGNNVISVAELTHIAGRDSLQAMWPVSPAAKPSWELLHEGAEWYSFTSHTQNAANISAPVSSIVINEIMCNPMSEQNNAQYIELYNKSGVAVSLTGWKLRGEVDFDFAAGTSIPGTGYLVIAANKAWLQPVYNGATMVGDWTGNLSKKGDLIQLEDQFGNLADEVDYKSGGDWPDLGSNRGSSLELINPNMDNNRASAWRASDESAKATFSTYSVSGSFQEIFDPTPVYTLNGFMGQDEYKEWYFRLPKDGHIELRNITLQQNGTSGNLLQNVNTIATNGSSGSGWLCQGTHAQTTIDGSNVMHLISDGHGDNKENRIEIDCTSINAGSNYTLSFEARWVSGIPRLVGEFCLQSMGKAWQIDVPNNLGTPGTINTRNSGNTPPQVDSVLHSPAVPKSNQSVKVTARVYSSAGTSSVQVFYRQDDINNANSYVSQTMVDDGSNGDAVAGDGVYTATVTAHQVNNRIVQFYVKATATNGQQVNCPIQGGSRPAMWIVDDRIINNDLRRQRFILSMYDRDALDTLDNPWGAPTAKYGYKYPRLQGHYFNMTFINNEADVYYLGEIRNGGSRWNRSVDAELKRGKWKLPSDRTFRNREKNNFDDKGLNNRTQLYLAYLLGFGPGNLEEYARTMVNSDGDQIRLDKELTDSDLLNRALPGEDDGTLYEIVEHYWTKDNYGDTFRKADWNYKGTDDLIRYHTNYPVRTRESQYDYSGLTEMFKLLSNSGTTREQLDRVLDPEYAMMLSAVRNYTGDWDGFPLNGKNGNIYQNPKDGRFQVLLWDGDQAFAGAPYFTYRAGWSEYQDKPWNRRLLNYYFTEILDRWTDNSPRMSAWLDAQENSSNAWSISSVNASNPGRSYYTDYFSGRKQSLIDAINQNVGSGGAGGAHSVGFTINSPGNGSSTSASTVNFTGIAPSGAFTVALDNHPEAVFQWINQTNWTLNGVLLKTSSNPLVFRMLDQKGAQTGSSLNWSVTKTGNAPPVIKLNVDPSSYNVTFGETLTLDAGASYDPDNSALTFNWSTTPSSGLTFTAPSAVPVNSVRNAVFTTAGIYTIGITATDSSSGSTVLNREFVVSKIADFDSFGSSSLGSRWIVANMENRDSFSPSRWYSLSDKPGQLVVQVLDISAKPLSYSNTHPYLVWNMPASSDCAILTDVTLETRKTGSFFTGLSLETVEGGVTTRYAFGLDSGTLISARRSAGGAFSDITTPVASTGDNAKLRIRRVGNQLRFERRNDATWGTLFTFNMTGGSTLSNGGVFLSTASAESARVAFDYFMLVDPTPSTDPNSISNSLRITELMYNPRGASEPEYIEVKNTGAANINLNGVKIDSGVTLNITTSITLTSGQFAIFTENAAAFNALYPGFQPSHVIQWTAGSLSNGGERINLYCLENAELKLIHNFEYSDTSPWPTYADGEGGALEVVNTSGDYSDPSNWRATGSMPGGGVDADGDGVPDAWEAKFGTSASNALSKPRATTSVNGSNQTQISWGAVSGQNYRVQYCDNLGDTWQTVSGGSNVSGVNGTVSFTDPQLPRPTKRFYRIMAL